MSTFASILSAAVLLGTGPASAQIPVVHDVLQVLVSETVPVEAQPTVTMATPGHSSVVHLECLVGDTTAAFTSGTLAPGDDFQITLPVGRDVTELRCLAVARFANGLSERKDVTLRWTWEAPAPAPAAEPDAADPTEPPADDGGEDEPRIKPLGTPESDDATPDA